MQLATLWDAEIVSADARQVYRGLDIGTSKPTLADQQRVPHHLLDLLAPDERYSASRFFADACASLEGIIGRGKRAIVVGGTGLYLKVLRDGLFEAPDTTPEVREQVDQLLSTGGKAALRDYLAKSDPHTLAALDAENPARLRRAVEFHLMTRESLTLVQQSARGKGAPFDFFPVVLVRPRQQLHERIGDRVKTMLESGWLAEVEQLSGVWDFALPGFDAVGYRELYAVVKQQVTLEQAVLKIVERTRQYAKRQVTWFTHQGTWLWMSPENEVTLKISSGLASFAENKSA
jgi:tRNA dimethylallyltransferase